VSSLASSAAPVGRVSRALLFASLALNLFFVGIFGALAVRHHLPDAGARPGEPPRTAGARIARLAAALPEPDGARLQEDFGARREAIEAAGAAYREAQEQIRAALRREPFDAAALREAMVASRAARLKLDEMVQEVIAAATEQMSPDGRRRVADYTPPPRGPESQK
jgi:uncharacterized membrane protein